MKNKIWLIFGIIFFLGVVSASTQTYELNINYEFNETNSSGNVVMEVSSPPDSIVSNPIDFDIYVEYNETLDCELTIAGIHLYSLPFSSPDNIELNSGDIAWQLSCNSLNSSFSEEEEGSFEAEDVNFSFGGIKNGGFYFNDKGINGSFGFTRDVSFELNDNDINVGLDSNDGSFEISKNSIATPGEYSLSAMSEYFPEYSESTIDFYVGTADLSLDDYSIDLGDTVSVQIEIDSRSFGGEYSIYLDGASSAWKSDPSFSNTIDESFDYTPNTAGDHTIKVVVEVDGEIYSEELTLDVDANEDDEDPEVTLVYPAWEEVIRDSEIEFIYDVTDNVDLVDCDLKLYNATENSAGLYQTDGLIFPLNNADRDLAEEDPLGKDDTIKLKLIDFDEGQYIWEVKCEDSSGNTNIDFNYFVVDLSGGTYNYSGEVSDGMDYAREEEVNDLVDKINSFLESADSLGLDESRAAEILEIEGNMAHYKKKLLQIDQDLKYNLKYMETSKYEKRIKEIDEDIDEIMENIIIGIKVTGTYEYSKSSADVDVGEVISQYFESTDQNIGGSALKKIIRGNEELQDSISTKVEVLSVEVEYIDGKKDMVLVSKKLDIDSNPAEKILEIIPEDLAKEVFFIGDGDDIGDGIWEVHLDKLEDSELVYYFFSDESLQNIEKTESLLFGEEIKGDVNLITGFVTGVGDAGGIVVIPFLLGFVFMGYVGFLMFGKARLEVWKKDPSVAKILDLIKQTKALLKENNVVDSRENYRKMGEAYKVLPNKYKSFFFEEIKVIRLAIDKKDVLNLIMEYEKSRSEGRANDAAEIHAKISEIYKKLPKKFQDKVYQRLIKNGVK